MATDATRPSPSNHLTAPHIATENRPGRTELQFGLRPRVRSSGAEPLSTVLAGRGQDQEDPAAVESRVSLVVVVDGVHQLVVEDVVARGPGQAWGVEDEMG